MLNHLDIRTLRYYEHLFRIQRLKDDLDIDFLLVLMTINVTYSPSYFHLKCHLQEEHRKVRHEHTQLEHVYIRLFHQRAQLSPVHRMELQLIHLIYELPKHSHVVTIYLEPLLDNHQ